MTQDLLAELISRGYHLRYLRGPGPWEACVTRPLPTTVNGNIYAVGNGMASTPALALDMALDAVERDYETFTEPTCDPVRTYITDLDQPKPSSPNLSSILANLRKTPVPVFTRKL